MTSMRSVNYMAYSLAIMHAYTSDALAFMGE